ncbi:MAG: hypothetical protein GY749_16930 [Desulfobacteraceae bacterium]|nr:hypothetical protein [Desulfobacteraceae bacterium]
MKTFIHLISVMALVAVVSTASAELAVTSVTPDRGVAGNDLNVTITGTGFDEKTRVSMYHEDGYIIAGSEDTPDIAYGVAVSDGFAYVGDNYSGLQIIDISHPGYPFIAGSTNTKSSIGLEVAVEGDFAYMIEYYSSGLQIIDVSDPVNPFITASVYLQAFYDAKVAVSGGFAYVTLYNPNPDYLQIIDVSDPANPFIVGSVPCPYRTVRDVAVSDGFAYAAYYTSPPNGGGLMIIDVSDPANPFVTGVTANADNWDYAHRIAVSEGFAYTTNPFALTITDVNDPANPFITGSVDTPSGMIGGIAVSGDFAYTTLYDPDSDKNGLQIIDVSDPVDPVIVGSVDTLCSEDFGFDGNVEVSGGFAYVAADYNGLQIIALPVEIKSVSVKNETELSLTLPGPARAGRYSIKVFNDSEKSELSAAVTFEPDWNPVPGKHVMNVYGKAAVEGKAVESDGYVIGALRQGGKCLGKTDFTNGGHFLLSVRSDTDSEKIDFQIWDSNTGRLHDIKETAVFDAGAAENRTLDIPLRAESLYPAVGKAGEDTDAKLAGSGFVENTRGIVYTDIGFIDTPGDSWRVAVSDGLAYVTGDKGLHIIDVSDPVHPFIAGSADIPGFGMNAVVSDCLAYVTDLYEEGLHIIDVSDPADPFVAGFFKTPGKANGVVLSGDFAYLTCYDRYDWTDIVYYKNSLLIIDVSDPAHLFIAGYLDISNEGAVSGVAVSGGFAYATVDSEGLLIIDVSDPAHPFIVGTVDTKWRQIGKVAVMGNFAYMTNSIEGLLIIDVSDPVHPFIAGSLDNAGYIKSVSDSFAYTTNTKGLCVIDIRDPVRPLIAGCLPINRNGVSVSGSTVYITNREGLRIINLTEVTDINVKSESSISLVIPGSQIQIPGSYNLWLYDSQDSAELERAFTFLSPHRVPGDITGDGTVDLADAVVALMIAAGINTNYINPGTDVNGDNRISTEDAVYILQHTAELRKP